MKKIVRDMSTAENKTFWQAAVTRAPQLAAWPSWKRAGINVAPIRQEPRELPSTTERLK